MNYFYFVGMDMAKNTFDATILSLDEQKLAYSQFENNKKGVVKMIKWVKSHKIKLSQILFCVENMGTYISELALQSTALKFDLALACPLSIKRSLGITRGKNDKIDSERIALYAMKFYRKLSIYKPIPDSVLQLQNWLNVRESLVKNKVSTTLIIQSMEQNALLDCKDQIKMLSKRLKGIESDIKQVELKMEEVVNSDESIKRNYELILSIKGIGKIVASVIITTTGNFTKFSTYRQYACYCGIAPFEHSSGTSIRGKTTVSSTSSTEIKTYITRSAISATRFDKQTARYFDRKIKEGKHYGSVLNAVKNKIVARCFAVVRRGTPYVELDI